MSPVSREELEELWKRVGLGELRSALEKVEGLRQDLERLLGDLPACDKCARAALMKQIEQAGIRLGGEVMGLTTMAASLQKTLAQAEGAVSQWVSQPAAPCRCAGEPCRCHG